MRYPDEQHLHQASPGCSGVFLRVPACSFEFLRVPSSSFDRWTPLCVVSHHWEAALASYWASPHPGLHLTHLPLLAIKFN